jgi:hypothetical protein
MKRLLRIIARGQKHWDMKRKIATEARSKYLIDEALIGFKPEEVLDILRTRAKSMVLITIPRPESTLTDVIFRTTIGSENCDFRRTVPLPVLQNLVNLAQQNNIKMDHRPGRTY